jgi:D-alanyl-D-alanine carboxypeptidase
MFCTTSTSWRYARFVVLGLATIITTILVTTDTADARRKRVRHHVRAAAYSPAFASIVVDANSGSTMAASNADSIRHPASLTKIMTLYMLFERLEQGKLKLDSEMEVSEHASEQAPTKLGLRPGQTLRVEDAIKALVTRSANDAAVVIAEAIGGEEEDFARMMTKKARALGMSKTVYRNASGLPDSQQVTTARDQAILGRAIQDRFPRYYRYFSTTSFAYRGRVIRNHNKLLGRVEGVDGIKTGYTRASGFNLVSSMKRGNRHIVAVVLGGRSGGSRDAIMRNLLAEHVASASTKRTVAAITERDGGAANTEVAEAKPATRPAAAPLVQVQGAVQTAAALPEPTPPPAPRAPAPQPQAATEPTVQAKVATPPAPFTNGVVSAQPLAPIPGSAEPMTPVRVKTVQIKAGAPMKLASATAPQAVPAPAPVVTAALPQTPAETSNAAVARSQKAEMPPQPAGHGTGQGVLGVLPANSVPAQALAYADPAPRAAVAAPQPKTVQDNGAVKAVHRSGWIIQVGALESESEARQRLDSARGHAKSLLGKADPFTETVAKGDKTLYRARFAGFEDRDQAEAACKALKRSSISCISMRN